MTRAQLIPWAAAGVSALTASAWSLFILLSNDTRDVSLVAGIVSGLTAGAALFFAAAKGSTWLAALLALPSAAALSAKPFVKPFASTYAGKTHVFSPTAETHLWYLLPGLLLGAVAVSLLLVPTRGEEPSKRELRAGFRIFGSILGLFGAAGLLLVFFDGRSSMGNVFTGLGASFIVGVLSLATMFQGEPAPPPPWPVMLSPYGSPAPPGPSFQAMGGDTNELLRAVAHAPAPAVNALPQGLLALPSGAQVGAFILGQKLGEGGMGVVYRALDQRLGREVALKLLPAHLAADPTRRARFFREARMAATVTHPNVATVYELGEINPPFIALELVLGETLRGRIERGFVGVKEAERLSLAIASGLAAAHERGVIHRDLKPENVMIAADGTPKLVDFGLARGAAAAEQRSTVSAAHTKSGWVLGTPRYMAPEQAAGGEVDARVDVYAFGLLLVELANGFGLDAATPAFRRAEAARAVVATTLPTLAAIAERCLAFSPDGRYADARALLAAMREATSSTLSPG